MSFVYVYSPMCLRKHSLDADTSSVHIHVRDVHPHGAAGLVLLQRHPDKNRLLGVVQE